MMTTPQRELFLRIQAFSLDHDWNSQPISQALAERYGWTQDYAQRVLDEYKRFCFISVTAKHPVCPPSAIECAWDMHQQNPTAYWNIFCLHVLRSPLYPAPKLAKSFDWYPETLACYEYFFEGPPPADIWPRD